MLIISGRKMPSIERLISIEFRDPAHLLSANILGSYLWRYLYLPSFSCLIHEHLRGSNAVSETFFSCFCTQSDVCSLSLLEANLPLKSF